MREGEVCVACGCEAEEGEQFCASCMAHYPPALRKAACDPFDYALGYKGRVIRFQEAALLGDWVRLYGMGETYGERTFSPKEFPHLCPRGVEIRVADIEWVADAPDGS